MGGDGLPIGQRAEFGVFPASPAGRRFHQFPVEFPAFPLQGRVVPGRQRELAFDRAVAFAVPVGTQVGLEILDRVDVVESGHDHAFGFDRASQAAGDRDVGIVRGGGFAVEFSVRCESLPQRHGAAHRLRRAVVGGREVEIAPVDLDLVAFAVEYFLLLASRADERQALFAIAFAYAFLLGVVDGAGGRRLEIDLCVVCGSVERTGLIRDVVHRAGDQVEVVEEQRRREGQRQRHRAADEFVDGLHGLHVGRSLHGRDREMAFASEVGIEGSRRGVDAHETVDLAIDAQRAHQRERLAGPVGRVAVVEVIARGPAAGVGVDGDQGIGRSAQCVPLRGLRGPCGRKKRCGRQNRYEQVFLHSYRNQR